MLPATVLKENSLSRLQTISIQTCGNKMTMLGVELLIHNCNELKLLKDLKYFSGIHQNELKILEMRIREENLDLRLNDKRDAVRDPSNPEFIKSLRDAYSGEIKDYFAPSTNCGFKDGFMIRSSRGNYRQV